MLDLAPKKTPTTTRLRRPAAPRRLALLRLVRLRTDHRLSIQRHQHAPRPRTPRFHHPQLVLRRRQIIRPLVPQTQHPRPHNIPRPKTLVQLHRVDIRRPHVGSSQQTRERLRQRRTRRNLQIDRPDVRLDDCGGDNGPHGRRRRRGLAGQQRGKGIGGRRDGLLVLRVCVYVCVCVCVCDGGTSERVWASASVSEWANEFETVSATLGVHSRDGTGQGDRRSTRTSSVTGSPGHTTIVVARRPPPS